MKKLLVPLLLLVVAGCTAQSRPFDKERAEQTAVLVTLCQQVRDLDFDIDTAVPGFLDDARLLPGFKQVRKVTAQQYNDMMGPIQRANQGGTYGLPERIGKQRPDCQGEQP